MSVHLFPFHLLKRLAVELEFLCVWVMTLDRLDGEGQGQGSGIGLGLRLSTDRWPYSIFYYEVISCALARRGVRRGTAKASGSGGVERVWA